MSGFIDYPWSPETEIEDIFLTGAPETPLLSYQSATPESLPRPSIYRLRDFNQLHADYIDLNDRFHEVLDENLALGEVNMKQAHQLTALEDFLNVLHMCTDNEQRAAEVLCLKREVLALNDTIQHLHLNMLISRQAQASILQNMAAMTKDGSDRQDYGLWSSSDMLAAMEIEMENIRGLLPLYKQQASIARFTHVLNQWAAACTAAGMPDETNMLDELD
ncbi:hypothetical protein C8J56DRAFT_905473 [Mycena floridula]|nr:hypothetical protein C8J56DRAFT_905473 [Mycena floridula]